MSDDGTQQNEGDKGTGLPRDWHGDLTDRFTHAAFIRFTTTGQLHKQLDPWRGNR